MLSSKKVSTKVLKSWPKNPFVLFHNTHTHFRSSFHTLCLYYWGRVHSLYLHLQATTNCPQRASTPPISFSSTSSSNVLLSEPLISEAGLLLSRGDGENTQDLTVTDESLSAPCLNQGQSAFSTLPLSPHTHVHSWQMHKTISATAASEVKKKKGGKSNL